MYNIRVVFVFSPHDGSVRARAVWAGLLCLLSMPAGCSREAFRGSVYESMRYTSNQKNALDPNYDADAIEGYGQYGAKRDQYLQDLTEQQSR